MHPRVAAAVTAVPAGCVNDDGAANFPSGGIVPERTVFECKFSVNGMHGPAQRKLYFRLGRVNLDDGLLGLGCGCQNQGGQPGGDRKQEWAVESAKGMGFANHQRYVRRNFHPKPAISVTLTEERGIDSV